MRLDSSHVCRALRLLVALVRRHCPAAKPPSPPALVAHSPRPSCQCCAAITQDGLVTQTLLYLPPYPPSSRRSESPHGMKRGREEAEGDTADGASGDDCTTPQAVKLEPFHGGCEDGGDKDAEQTQARVKVETLSAAALQGGSPPATLQRFPDMVAASTDPGLVGSPGKLGRKSECQPDGTAQSALSLPAGRALAAALPPGDQPLAANVYARSMPDGRHALLGQPLRNVKKLLERIFHFKPEASAKPVRVGGCVGVVWVGW